MTLTVDGVRQRACYDCGRKWALELGKGSDIGISVGGELFSYHPSKELIAEVREKAKSGRLMCAYCSHRIAEADLAEFHVYIPHDMKSRHTYTLCPACQAKVIAGDKQILEDVEEKIESGRYELGEKAGDYELMGEPIHVNIPTEKQWAIYFTYKDGETSVSHEKGMIVPRTHEGCRDFIANFRPFHDPSRETFFTTCRAVPRSEYNPKKHDAYHLRLGSDVAKVAEDVKSFGQRVCLLVSETNISSALDVMARLQRVILDQGPRLGDVRSGEFLATAHPFVWKPQMVAIANNAVRQLTEEISVTEDLLPLAPSIHLYYEPGFVLNYAHKAFSPATFDGHIPWPDEEVVDIGRFQLALILNLGDQEFTHCHVVLEMSDKTQAGWALRLYEYSEKLGSTPHEVDSQDILKTLLFLQSPYLVWRAEKPQRSFVRRTRGLFPTAEERINVVLLRRMVELRKQKHEEGYEPVEWSCQWWVSGHWRFPRHPRFKSHNPIWIAPYIKGPPDRPLKDTVRLIVR